MLRIAVLGELRLEAENGALQPPRSRRARSVLGWLALHPGTHARSKLAAVFWPDVPESSARASLRSALWSLRRSLGPAAEALAASSETVGLATSSVWLDAEAFEERLRSGRLEDALQLCRGELLADLDDDWVLAERDAHRRRRGELFGQLGALAQQSGEPEQALRWVRRRVSLDPLDEAAVRELVSLLVAAGDRTAAMVAVRDLDELLRSELGVAVSAETRALIADLDRGVDAAPEAPQGRPRAGDDGRARSGADAQPPERTAGDMLGREPELERLLSSWRASASGTGLAATISGPAGIGKSRLARELVRRARAEGAVTAVATPVGFGTPPALSLWAEACQELIRQGDGSHVGTPWSEDLSLMPGMQSLRPDAGAAKFAPEHAQARIYDAVPDLLEWASAERPLLLVLEDLHAADSQSLELAAYASRRIAHLPVLMVLTRRGEPGRGELDALLRTLREREALDQELSLDGLDDGTVKKIARDAGVAGDDELERLVAEADGNPLLVISTARARAGNGESAPTTLAEAARAWSCQVPEQARLLIDAVAVIGREVGRDELEQLPIEDPVAAAESALQTGLLVSRGRGFAFRHALLRDAVYGDLAAPRRERMHELIADAIAASGGSTAEVAAHLREAGRRELATAALREAALTARSIGSLDEAARLTEEALELDPDSAELSLEMAEVEAERVRPEEVGTHFARALELLKNDGPGLVDAWSRRARWYRGALCSPGPVGESARKVFEVIDAFGLDLATERDAAIAALAWSEAIVGDPGEAERLLSELPPADGAHDDRMTALIGEARGLTLIRRSEFERSYEPLAAAARAARRTGRTGLAGSCWLYASSAAACAADDRQALEFAARSDAVAAGAGSVIQQAWAAAARAHVLVRLGRLDEAAAAADLQEELVTMLDNSDLTAEALHTRAVVAFAAGENESAARLLARSLEHDPPLSRPLARLLRADALLRLDRCDEAESEIRKAVMEPVRAADLPETLVPKVSRAQGLVAMRRGDRALAVRRLTEAAEGWRRLAAPQSAGSHYASVLADLGRLPVAGLVEPERELADVEAFLDRAEAEPVEPIR